MINKLGVLISPQDHLKGDSRERINRHGPLVFDQITSGNLKKLDL